MGRAAGPQSAACLHREPEGSGWMSVLLLNLFGVPEAQRDGVVHAVPRVKPLALLAYLAIEGGVHPRERLVALLWPEMGEQNGRANLRTTLAILRRALGERDGEPPIWRAVSD